AIRVVYLPWWNRSWGGAAESLNDTAWAAAGYYVHLSREGGLSRYILHVRHVA
ncbi:hypothetical protein ACLOJK_019438, partial [Asimina triloba]